MTAIVTPSAGARSAAAVAAQAAAEAGGEGEFDWSPRARRYAWWVVVVLAVGMMLSLLDRMVLALLIEPIKRDLGITDTQVGLLHGLAFTLLYVLAGLPLGWLVDRWSRRAIAGLSVMAWSVMTALCGFANSFSALFLARVGVGVGEAGLSPAATSLISDYFPPAKRAPALLSLALGAALGGGVALIFGGVVMHLIGARPSVEVPGVGALRSWQVVFLLLGVIGVAYSLVFLTVREPPRRERIASGGNLTTGAAAAYIWGRRAILAPHFLGVGSAALVLMAMNLWGPSVLIRRFGWDAATVGLGYGLSHVISSILGVIAAGVITARLGAKGGVRDNILKVSFWAVIGALAPLALAPLAPAGWMFVGLFAVGLVALTVPIALGPVFLQTVCGNEVRGQVVAIYVLVMAVIGNVLGPLIVGFVTDTVLSDATKLHISLLIVIVVFLPLSALAVRLAMRGSRHLERAGAFAGMPGSP